MRNESNSDAEYNVSRETNDRLQLLESLVRQWNSVINLVSRGSLEKIRKRHIIDSVQIFNLAAFKQGLWCDLGSGGGFPGLVVAILARDLTQPYEVRLIESDGRKAAFLREAARKLDVRATVVNARIEDIQPLSAAVLSARALSALPKLCEYASLHLGPDGMALFPKGSSYETEVQAARKRWSFDLVTHPSRTDPTAAILELRNIRHA